MMGAPCLFGGQRVPNGIVIKGYKRSVSEMGKSCDDSANSRELICSNGAIVGQNEFPNASCSMAQTQNASPCANFVGSGKPDITNGGTLVVFRATKATQSQSCANLSITLACNNGSYKTLSGESTSLSSYFSECQELQSSCVGFDGISVPHNSSISAYEVSSVQLPSTCLSKTISKFRWVSDQSQSIF
jgi:hypothetical protein